jgi:hypothetical protein
MVGHTASTLTMSIYPPFIRTRTLNWSAHAQTFVQSALHTGTLIEYSAYHDAYMMGFAAHAYIDAACVEWMGAWVGGCGVTHAEPKKNTSLHAPTLHGPPQTRCAAGQGASGQVTPPKHVILSPRPVPCVDLSAQHSSTADETAGAVRPLLGGPACEGRDGRRGRRDADNSGIISKHIRPSSGMIELKGPHSTCTPPRSTPPSCRSPSRPCRLRSSLPSAATRVDQARVCCLRGPQHGR